MNLIYATPDLQDLLPAERARLGLSVETLALHSGVPVDLLRKIERGWHAAEDSERRSLEVALILPAGVLGSLDDV